MFNFVYDPQRQGYSTDLWKTLAGTPSASGVNLLFNADAAIHYADCLRGVFDFKATLPATPKNGYLTGGTAATSQIFGILTGGTAATSVIATWNAVSDGEFTITIDGTAYDVTGLDFSLAADMDAVAAIIQAAIRVLTGGTETVVWSTNKFIITAQISVSVTSAVAGGTGTDISGAGATTFMDGETGVGTATTGWQAVTDGEFTVTIDGVAYDVTALDFTTAGTMAGVAAIIQAAIRTLTGNTETVVWSTNKFIITAKTEVSVLSAVSGGSGTDISGAGSTTFMDGETGVGTATAGDNKILGLISLNKDIKAVFHIYGNELRCIVKDDDGNTVTKILPWVTSWSSAAAVYQIKWSGQGFTFRINNVQVATLLTNTINCVMSPYINNVNADNLLVGYVEGHGIDTLL